MRVEASSGRLPRHLGTAQALQTLKFTSETPAEAVLLAEINNAFFHGGSKADSIFLEALYIAPVEMNAKVAELFTPPAKRKGTQ